LVIVLSPVDYFDDGRISIRRDLNEIQTLFFSDLQSLCPG
jgi:hypothetical protein